MTKQQTQPRMIGSDQVLQFMQKWWNETPPDAEGVEKRMRKRTSFMVTLRGLIFLNQSCVYKERKTFGHSFGVHNDSARISHYRQMLTTWKAVCKKLEKPGAYEFGIPAEVTVRMFPLFYEDFMPELYYLLRKGNAFLGIPFTEEDQERLQALEDKFLKDILEKEKKRDEDAFFNMFFGIRPKAGLLG